MKLLMVVFGLAMMTPVTFAEEAVPADAQIVGTVGLSPAGTFKFWTMKVNGKINKTATGYAAPVLDIDVSTIKAGLTMREDHMKNKYMEVAKYPKAYLRDVTATGGKFKATLESHGAKHAVDGSYEIVANRIKAKFTVKQSDYNIPKTKYMGVGADDEVELTTNIPL